MALKLSDIMFTMFVFVSSSVCLFVHFPSKSLSFSILFIAVPLLLLFDYPLFCFHMLLHTFIKWLSMLHALHILLLGFMCGSTIHAFAVLFLLCVLCLFCLSFFTVMVCFCYLAYSIKISIFFQPFYHYNLLPLHICLFGPHWYLITCDLTAILCRG